MKLTNFLPAVVALVMAVGLLAVNPRTVQAHQTANPDQSSCWHQANGVTTCCHQNYCSGSNVKNVCITCNTASGGFQTDWADHSNCQYSNLPDLPSIPLVTYGAILTRDDSAYDSAGIGQKTTHAGACSTVCETNCQVTGGGPTTPPTAGGTQMLSVTKVNDYQCTTELKNCPTNTQTGTDGCSCVPIDTPSENTSAQTNVWNTACDYGSNNLKQNWCAINASCTVDNWITVGPLPADNQITDDDPRNANGLPVVRCPQGTRLINRGTVVTSTAHQNQAKFSGSSYCEIDASCSPPTCSGLTLTPSKVFPSITGSLVNVTAAFTASTTNSYLHYAKLLITDPCRADLKTCQLQNPFTTYGTGTFTSGDPFTAPHTAFIDEGPGYYQVAVNTYSSDCTMIQNWKGYWQKNTTGKVLGDTNPSTSCPAGTVVDLGYSGNGCKAGLNVVDFDLAKTDTNSTTLGDCTATQGGTNSTCSTITVDPLFGFDTDTTLTVPADAAPTGANASIDNDATPKNITLANTDFASGADLNITNAGTCASYPCQKTITITGSATVAGTTRSKTVNVILYVTAPPTTPDFSLVNSGNCTATQGGSNSSCSTITVNSLRGFDSTVSLSVAATGGATVSIPASLASAAYTTGAALNVTNAGTCASSYPCQKTITITGTGGTPTLTRTTRVTLTVNAAGVVAPPPAASGSIFEIIPFNDVNGNGTKDSGEGCRPSTVQITPSNCTSSGRGTCASASPFSFNNTSSECDFSSVTGSLYLNLIRGSNAADPCPTATATFAYYCLPKGTSWDLTITLMTGSNDVFGNTYEFEPPIDPTTGARHTWTRRITIP